MELSDLFTRIDCNSIEQPVEFPLDILSNTEDSGLPYAVKKGVLFTSIEFDAEPLQIEDDCCVVIPLVLTESEAVKYAPDCILAAALDRNVIVYDDEHPGELGTRLLSLLRTTYRHNLPKSLTPTVAADRITDIFYDKNHKYTESFGKLASVMKIRLHPIDMSDNNKYYLDTLGGTFPSHTNNLVIAVSKSADNFVMPYKGKQWGCGILNNRKVLLGAY
jgi:hypothetical protein